MATWHYILFVLYISCVLLLFWKEDMIIPKIQRVIPGQIIFYDENGENETRLATLSGNSPVRESFSYMKYSSKPVEEVTHENATGKNSTVVQKEILTEKNQDAIVTYNRVTMLPEDLGVTDERSSAYYNRTGFYQNPGICFPVNESHPIERKASIVFEIGQTYALFTSNLQPERIVVNERLDTEWTHRFNALQTLLHRHYKSANVTSFKNQYPSKEYTRMKVNTALDIQSAWIYAENLCYDRKKNNYLYYSVSGSGPHPRDYGKQFFRFGWSFGYMKEKIPNDVIWREEPGYYLGHAFRTKHITHFAESINLLILKLLAPDAFPPLKTLVLSRFRAFDEYKWSKEYMKLLLESFPADSIPSVNTMEDIIKLIRGKNGTLICYRSATLMDRMAYNKDGGIFGGFLSADWMRALSYKHAGIHSSPARKTVFMGVLTRSSDRQWVNLKRYLRIINRHFNERLNVTVLDMLAKTYQEQTMMFFDKDIILGGHGSAMANVFFMVPHSVLIECNPPYFYEMCFANIAWIARLHYISVTNYNATLIRKTLRDPESLYRSGKFFIYRRKWAEFKIYPNVLSVLSAVQDAYEYVQFHRYKAQRCNEWSKVF